MTQELVAQMVGMSVKWLSNIETGYRPAPPRYDILLKLGLYLGINEKDLMWSAAKYYMDLKEANNEKTKADEGT